MDPIENQDEPATAAGTPTAEVTSTQTAPEPAASPRTFTQEEVDRIAAQARNEGRQSASRKSSQNDKEPSKASAAPDLVEQIRVLDAVASVKVPTAKAREMLVRELAASKPEDPTAFARSWAESMGFAQAEAASASPAKPAAQSVRPQSDAGTPATTTQGERSPNPLAWTNEDYDAYFRQHAKVPGNKYDVRNREVYRAIRRMTEGQLANTAIYIGPPKR